MTWRNLSAHLQTLNENTDPSGAKTRNWLTCLLLFGALVMGWVGCGLRNSLRKVLKRRKISYSYLWQCNSRQVGQFYKRNKRRQEKTCSGTDLYSQPSLRLDDSRNRVHLHPVNSS